MKKLSLITQKVHIKTAIRSHYIPIKILQFKIQPNVEDTGQLFYRLLVGM